MDDITFAVALVWIIITFFLLLNIVRELMNIRDIKSRFTCENCGTFHNEVTELSNCKKCHRNMNIKQGSWWHLITSRTNRIGYDSKSTIYNYKQYRKLSIIEIAISICATLIMLAAIVITIS